MAKARAAKLHLLTVREVQTAGDDDHSDGGGLMLRVRGVSASWMLRYTSPAGRRREMGLGPARRGSAAETGDSLTVACKLVRDARDHVQAGVDPIEERRRRRDAARQAEQAGKVAKQRQQLTLARAARVPRADGRAGPEQQASGAVDRQLAESRAARDLEQADRADLRARTPGGPIRRALGGGEGART